MVSATAGPARSDRDSNRQGGLIRETQGLTDAGKEGLGVADQIICLTQTHTADTRLGTCPLAGTRREELSPLGELRSDLRQQHPDTANPLPTAGCAACGEHSSGSTQGAQMRGAVSTFRAGGQRGLGQTPAGGDDQILCCASHRGASLHLSICVRAVMTHQRSLDCHQPGSRRPAAAEAIHLAQDPAANPGLGADQVLDEDIFEHLFEQ